MRERAREIVSEIARELERKRRGMDTRKHTHTRFYRMNIV